MSRSIVFVLALPAVLLLAAPVSAQDPVPPADGEAAVRYFELHERAREHYRAGRYFEAEPLLAELTGLFPADASNWYRLARARQLSGRSAEALGPFLAAWERGYRYGAWIPYQIARIHGESGSHPSSAFDWLERALEAGLGERPAIEHDGAFAAFGPHPHLLELSGRPTGPVPDRDEMWRRDIDFFVAEARRLHAHPDRPAHSAAFERAATALKERVPELSDDRMLLEMSRLATRLGDGHTGIFGGAEPETPLTLEGTSLPLLFHDFTDGLFVVDATEEHRDWIGAEVIAFGDVPAERAIDSLSSVVHHDNRMTVRWLGVRFVLPTLTYLQAIGAADDLSRATLTLRAPAGRTPAGRTPAGRTPAGRTPADRVREPADGVREVTFQGGDHMGSFRRKLRPPPTADSVPLWLSRVDTPYWLRALPSHDALYFQFNQVRDAEDGPSLAEFPDTLRRALERTGARRLIVDVRHNNGGNNGLLGPLLRTLVWWEVDEPGNTVYVITSRNTFSAAQNFINRLERIGEPVFVGEPSSSRPNFTGETTEVVLPWTRVRGSVSNRYWQDSDPDDRRSFIPPVLPVGLSSEQYFSGRDPALEALLELFEGS